MVDDENNTAAPNLNRQGTGATNPGLLSLVRKGGAHDWCCRVLFLCPDNSVSSIFAEALLRRWGGSGFRGYSAGCQPAAEVHPLAIGLLKLQRVWQPELRPKHYDQFLHDDAPKMNFVISLGERPPDGLPSVWPGSPRMMHWHITEPVVFGEPAERKNTFRRTLSELETRIKLFVLVFQKEAQKKFAA